MKIKDIAKLAGVSTATVSRVINSSAVVKKETKLKILKIIKEKKYRPNITAQNLAKNQTNTIGVVIPDLENPFFNNIIKGIYETLEKENSTIILFSNDGNLNKQKKIVTTLIEQRVKGVIIVPVSDESSYNFKPFQQLDEFKIPYVFIDREIKGVNFSKVYLENRKGAYKATRYLLEKTKDISMISGPIKTTTAIKRVEGFKNAMSESGLIGSIYYGDYKIDSGYKIICKMIKNSNLPKALFIANNMMTLGVIKGLIENNINISENIKLFSFDKIEMAEIFGINIDYLEFDVKSIGVKAVKILKSKLHGETKNRVIQIPGNIKKLLIIKQNKTK